MIVTSSISLMTTAALVTACTSPHLTPRAACGETADHVCYGIDGGESQSLDIADIEYVASYLRISAAGQLWTMPLAIDCEEWTIEVPGAGTVLTLAKHINPGVNSSVLYDDIANTIDGGEGASEEQRSGSLLGCAENGGQLGVRVDPENPAYNTPEYADGEATPEGIVIKLVRAPEALK